MGPHFIVRHGYHRPETLCLHGETVEGVSLCGESAEHHFEFGLALMLLLDLLCRFRRTLLSASQIASILNNDPFYVHYGSNARGGHRKIASVNPASVRVYIGRIRGYLAGALQLVGLPIDPHCVLTGAVVQSNVKLYKLRATAEVVHFDGAWRQSAAETMASRVERV
jgi:hypothetical protein